MLCPHPNLKKLEIRDGYLGLKLPNWLSSITNLVEISLEDCRKCEFLPSLHNLPCLKKLKMMDCPQLKGINYTGDGDEDEDVPSFHCLGYLYIRDCLKLTRMPTFPIVEGDLELIRASLKPLARTMKMKMKPVAMILPLSKLTHLTIWDIVDLEFLPEEGLCNLTSLKELVIVSCPKLGYLPPEMRHLTSLRTLVILSCPHLTERCRKGEGEDWLNICHIAKIVLDREIVQDSGESEASVVDDPLVYEDSEMMKNNWQRSTSLNFYV
ncbi:Disease resistance protein RGA2 [Linum perenne]